MGGGEVSGGRGRLAGASQGGAVPSAGKGRDSGSGALAGGAGLLPLALEHCPTYVASAPALRHPIFYVSLLGGDSGLLEEIATFSLHGHRYNPSPTPYLGSPFTLLWDYSPPRPAPPVTSRTS